MSEKLIDSDNITPAATELARDENSSRSSSPDVSRSAEILEHSMESLIISDSSEGCISTENLTQNLELEVVPDESVTETGRMNAGEDSGGKVSEETLEEQAQEEDKAAAKRKKRRISSRRPRKISLTSSDKVVCKIAGVQVTS